MGSYSGACEIVEARDELNSVEQARRISRSYSGLMGGGNDRKSPILKPGYRDFLDDDINHLFEAISLKNLSKGPGLSSQASTSTSPMSKNAMKRPITVGMPHSSGVGNSESLSLKQALRELCISKASEMAAMKRLSMSSSSPGMSEAGRIKSLYNSVVVETGRSSLPFDKSKGTMVEVSLAPEESGSTSSGQMHQQLLVPKVKSSNQSALSPPGFQTLKSPNQCAHSSPQFSAQTSEDIAGMRNDSFSWPREVETQTLRSVNESALSSPRFGVPKTQAGIGTTLTQNEVGASLRKVGSQAMKSPTQSVHSSPCLANPQNGVGMQNEFVSASIEFGTQALKYPSHNALSSPRFTVPKMQIDVGTATMQNEIGSLSTKVGNQALKFLNKSTDSSPPVAPTTMQNGIENSSVQKNTGYASRKVRNQALKTEMARLTAATSPHTSVSVDNALKPDINVPISTKAASKASGSRSGCKGRLRAAASSVNGNRVSKVTKNYTCMAKPVVRSKSSVKRKIKEGTTYVAALANGGENTLAPSTGQLVCQGCQCALMNVTGNSDRNFLTSFSASLGAEVTVSNANPSAYYSDLSSSNCSRSRDVGQAKKNPKSREKGEFSHSSKSSLGDYSTCTSNSEESNASRSSCCNRPHMSNDIRWEAIRHVKMRDGALNLRHFSLLKKLGCGDIGTVYLAELIGSNCLFAIKVMDSEFLARRKKMPRAQTEREILRILDHPFLPTLYAQFTSENLLCLVMEYCPGGDLHVLRQKQPSQSFLEPAARFYVAEVLLALEYLHMLGVIYRDLKPENILVREDGHIMLTDFDLSLRSNVSPTLLKSSSTDVHPVRISGLSAQSSCIEPLCIELSCQVPCFSPGFLPKARKLKADIATESSSLPRLVAEPTDARSNSFVGTHEYLAPEIIKGEGHGAAVDWWTFGVFLYELLYGKTPFKGSGNDETLANVVLQTLEFPDTPLVSFQARDLISGLLVKEPKNRLGSQKGAAEVKQHPFFEGLNWALIRCAIPPELPEFYDFGVPKVACHDKNSKYLEFKAIGEHLEFELF